jgi:hypothetical protein
MSSHLLILFSLLRVEICTSPQKKRKDNNNYCVLLSYVPLSILINMIGYIILTTNVIINFTVDCHANLSAKVLIGL